MAEIVALIPAYNEEKNIEEVIGRLKTTLPKAKILVIDDGSNDRTKDLAKGMGVEVISHEVNRGKGEALKTGFKYILNSKAEFVIVIDADLQFQPEEAHKVLRPLLNGEADFVMGSRNWKEIPFRHRLGNLVWSGLFNLLFGTKLTDTNSGFISLTRDALERVRGAGGGYVIENYMLIQMVRNNMKIVNVPVTVLYNHKSGVIRGIRVVLGILVFIIKEGLKYRLRI